MKVGALWVVRAPGVGGGFQRVLALHLCFSSVTLVRGFPGGSDGKESVCITGDLGSIPGSGRSPREGNSYPLQYSSELSTAFDLSLILTFGYYFLPPIINLRKKKG